MSTLGKVIGYFFAIPMGIYHNKENRMFTHIRKGK